MEPIFLFLASSSNIQSFLRKIERAVSSFSGPPRHHVPPSQPQPLPRDLLTTVYVFVREDASKPPLSPLYRGPYKVLERFEKFFILKIGDKSDSVSMDTLKAIYSSVPVTPAFPLPEDVLVYSQPLSLSLLLLSTLRRRLVSRFLFLLRSSAEILTGRSEVFCILPPSSGLSFWGEYLWLLWLLRILRRLSQHPVF